MEELLLDEPGIGFPAAHILVTRLAAQHPHRPSTSRFQSVTLSPTKANVVAVLQALASPEVKPDDRVLIYYSGHGDKQQWVGSSVWHEALALHNGQEIEYLWDVEINQLVVAIAQRTSDVTVIFDCCHSAGTTRGPLGGETEGCVRSLGGERVLAVPPDLVIAGNERGTSAHMLQSTDPSYLVAAACQPHEKAGEGVFSADGRRHGAFTHSLCSLLEGADAARRATLRWADIWPELLERTNKNNNQIGLGGQHPWLIGRSERRIFGGPWQKMDAGLEIRQQENGEYTIGAGTQMGVTLGAEIAVYGDQPQFFPPIGALEDQPIGRLRIIRAERSRSVGRPIGEPFVLPDGARGRLVKAGEDEQLRVGLTPAHPALAATLSESPVLSIVDSADAEVEVVARPGGGRGIGNQTEAFIAAVPSDEIQALRAGLEHYYRYNTLLRMAHNGVDIELRNCLNVEMLDCNDTALLAELSEEALADPPLAEAPRHPDGSYGLPVGFRFCIRVSNNSTYPLNVTLFNCSAGGMVEFLSDALLRAKSSHVMWLDNNLGRPFETWPDELPNTDLDLPLPLTTIDRLVAIGTTRQDVDLKHFTLDKTVQEVVDENLRINRGVRPLGAKPTTGLVELWTATIAPFHLPRQGRG